MNTKKQLLLIILIINVSCSTSTLSNEFINNTKGRYLYNYDEIINVYYNNNQLFLKWRGANNIKPLKVNDSTFFVKEMNEKIQFKLNNSSKYFLHIIPKENDSIQYNFRKLAINEKIPSEYLNEGNFEKALEGYKKIKQKDSLSQIIKESYFNRLGYDKLKKEEFNIALDIFKVNIELYPKSANVYDSYADALKRSGDTINAIVNYKKSLEIDSGNIRAKKFIDKYDKK